MSYLRFDLLAKDIVVFVCFVSISKTLGNYRQIIQAK
jgi:hypothetical protein